MVETQYRSDLVFQSTASVGAAPSILIACMGLFGLASFVVLVFVEASHADGKWLGTMLPLLAIQELNMLK